LARIINVSGYIYEADDFHAGLDPVPPQLSPWPSRREMDHCGRWTAGSTGFSADPF
jgi:hypothetical protein